MPSNLFSDLQDEINNQQGEEWRKEWKGMPEFVQNDLEPYKSVLVHFETEADMLAFAKLVDQKISFKTPSIWYPKAEVGIVINKFWTDEA